MKKVIGAFLAGILLLFVLLMVSEYRQESRTFADQQTFTTQINTIRAGRDLESVQDNSELVSLAEYKCNDMVKRHYHAHIDPDGKYIWDYAPKGYKYGENLAGGFYSSYEVVQNWVNSPEHLENIKDPVFTQVGHATCFDGKQYLNVQVFRS